ncbi:MAG: exodeoxyribonuclease VII small subunit [Lachnospiraceae bacterium]
MTRLDKQKTIEETFAELEAIVSRMEQGESSLEESFLSYETGMKLVKSCNEMIDQVEKQMIILSENGEEDER